MIQKFKWGKWGSILFLGIIACLAGIASAATPKISYPPPPGWVQELKWTALANWQNDADTNTSRCLLYEDQERPSEAERFIRVIVPMENQGNVQDYGTLSFSFVPDYQELLLHQVVIHRDGKTINCLNPSKIRLIQREPGLNGNMITGRETALVFVEGLRVGDVLEYAYTVRGANPVLGGHYSGRFLIQSGMRFDRKLFRVVWDKPTPLHERTHLTNIKPVIKPWGNGTEYIWNLTNEPAIPYEDDQPPSYESHPYVELSDFPDWSSVVKWALPLYNTTPTNIPPELQKLVSRWNNPAWSKDEKARQALQFVQDEIRYTGIELGPDSYRPTDPIETFQKRFGDCKGKTVLLCLLLRAMNIEAFPAMVNSSVGKAIANRLPSPFDFDHVIAQIQLDGKSIWVDPTYSRQGGTLENHYLPPYGKALVIRPGNSALENIPPNKPATGYQRKTISAFTIKNYKSPVKFTVRTEYRGGSADNMREEITGADRSDITKNYLNYYARFYPGITSRQPLKITDDRLKNILVVQEFYTITNLWQSDKSGRLWVAQFYSDNLYNALADPSTRIRKTPLYFAYPSHRQQEILVHLPDADWHIPDLTTNIENPAFSFRYHRELRGSTVKFQFECRTKLASLPAALVPGYLTKFDEMQNLLSHSLQHPKNKAVNGINWLMVMIALFGSGFTAMGGIWYWRRETALSQPDAEIPPLLSIEDQKLQGLGGWLILVGFGLCLAPILRIIFFSQHWTGYFSIQVWQTVAMPDGASYHPLYAPMLVFELLGNTVVMGLNILALFLFFSKRKAFPRVFIAMIMFNALFLILDGVGSQQIHAVQTINDGETFRDAFRATIYAIIWSAYMVKSRRVKATFVN